LEQTEENNQQAQHRQVVPFHKADIGEEEATAAADVIRSGWLTTGPKTFEFEQQFACFVGAKHAIAVNSCTAALHLALEAAGIQRGEEVLVPSITFTATAEVVTYLGARPVIVDVEPDTLTISPQDAERKITPKTRAIVPVHYGGQPADMDKIRQIAEAHSLRVIEDAAHSLPASYRGVSVGRISELTAFSFYATKTLATGEGGMVTCEDDSLAERMRIMRLHGIGRDAWKRYRAEGTWYYEVLQAGFKYNLTDIQSAIGLVQLRKCNEMHDLRCRIVQRYNEAFSRLEQLQVPVLRDGCNSAWHLYPLRLNLEQLRITRDGMIEQLKQKGIGTSVHFIPLHLHPYYRNHLGYRPGDFPIAEQEYERYLSLPLFPGMTPEQVEYVISQVSEIVKESRR
jgi:perosamine synthetase